MEEKNYIYLSAQPKAALIAVFRRAAELDVQGLGNAELLERAEKYLCENKDKIDLVRINRMSIPEFEDLSIPSSFKVRVEQQRDTEVTDIMRKAFSISRVSSAFKIRNVMAAYIKHLEKENTSIEHPKAEEKDSIDPTIDSLRIKAIQCVLAADSETLKDILNRLN